MIKGGPTIVLVASDAQGGGRIRSFWPADELRRRGWNATATLVPPEPGTADLLVVHRPLDRAVPDLIRAHQRAGAVVVVDEDDHLDVIPETSRWQPTAEALARHDRMVAAADGVIVTTPALAARYGPPLAARAWLVRNHLPLAVGARRFYPRDGRVRVGWAGIVGTHRHDLEWVARELRPALGRATLSLVGDPAALRVLRCGGQPHELFGFQASADGLYKLMARADVGIVPLAPCPFNAAKSWLKALEYMSLGKPVVVADLPEQRRLVEDGVSGFVVATPEEFAGRVAELVADGDLRMEMGAAARARARALCLEEQGTVWEEMVRGALAGRSVPCGPVTTARGARAGVA